MNQFIHMVLSELRQSMAGAVAVAVIAGLVLRAVYKHHKQKYGEERPFPWRKAFLILTLALYLAIVSYATLSRLGGYGASGVNIHLFRAWREAWNDFSVTAWLNVLLNIVLFIPLGMLLPVIWKRFRKWYAMLSVGFGLSMYIELMQYLGGRGILDVDDLFCNSLGAMMGYFLIMTVFTAVGKQLKRCLAYTVLAMIPCAAVSCVFYAYQTQEYGNIPGTYTHTLNTKNVEWFLACELPEMPASAAVYKLDVPTQGESDAFSERVEQIIGAEFERTDYYDESIMYMKQGLDDQGAHFLTVQRIDGSFEYTGHWIEEPACAEADRETIEGLLDAFGVAIPADVSFSYDGDGWYSFTAEWLTVGETVMDGVLRCRYCENGVFSEIENSLLTYTYYSEEPIYSPKEAYELLCAGRFGNASGIFEAKKSGKMKVVSCTLTYQADTKGYYQPVYIFEIENVDETMEMDVIIPAISG